MHLSKPKMVNRSNELPPTTKSIPTIKAPNLKISVPQRSLCETISVGNKPSEKQSQSQITIPNFIYSPRSPQPK